MVAEGTRTMPKCISEIVQSSIPHGLVGQEIKCLIKAIKLDFLDIELIMPSFISIAMFYFILTTCSFVLNSITKLLFGFKMNGTNEFVYLYLFLLFSGVLSGYLYMLIMKRNHIGIMAHAYCTMYSLVYFPVGAFIIGIDNKMSFLFSFLGVSMISEFFLQGSITNGEIYRTEKQRFLVLFTIFLSQSAIVYVGLKILRRN